MGACADIGESQQDGSINPTQFRLSDGTIVTNTASITRGFKDGYNIMQTGGKGQPNLISNEWFDAARSNPKFTTDQYGDGGAGVKGGNGATGPRGGGGGGAGYTDGSVEVVATQLGGSVDAAKCILRVVT